ncbi:MAG: class C sortase [Eubacteriales bacterium]|nr:class C sortase [Eubacteriales bacterium]
MFRKIMDTIVTLIITVGVMAVCYPSFATFINQKFANREIVAYQEQMDSSSKDKLEMMEEMADRYNVSLPISFPADPFSESNISDFKGTEFEDFEMVKEGAMLGYLEIPKIDVYLPIYYGTSDEVLSEGLGLVENTSLPVGGKGTHSVISGHSGMASKKLLTDLNLVEEDDIFFLHVLNQHLAYQVNQIKVVWPYETDDLYIVDEKDYSTLLTCTPFGVNDHRLLVRGERIDYDFTTQTETTEITAKTAADKYLWMFVGGAYLLIILIVLIRKRMKKSAEKRRLSAKEQDERQ